MRTELLRPMVALVMACASGSAAGADVTWARLLAAGTPTEAGNWLMTNGDLGGHRYSPLSTINRENAAELRLSFSHPGQIGSGELFELSRISAPLVDGGMLYFVDGLGRIIKVDFTQETPAVAWTADAAFGKMDAWLAGQWTLALAGDSVLAGTGDGTVYWLDSTSGQISGTAKVGDAVTGYQLAAAPQVLEDRVLLGGAGTERGAELQMDAVDLSGAPLWTVSPAKTLMSGAPAAPGGSFLRTGSYDPEDGLAYWTTGGALPPLVSGPGQPGIANMLMAIDPANGELRWSHRFAEGDPPHLHSEAATPLVVSLPGDGGAGTKVLHFGDNGVFYRLDGTTGALELSTSLLSAPLAKPSSDLQCTEVLSEPHLPITWSERTHLVYAAINNSRACGPIDESSFAGETTVTGELVAIDPATGSAVARRTFGYPLQSGLLSTGGGLVVAVTADGTVHVVDDETLETLWSFDLPSVRASPPITFEARGRQYIAVLSGGGPLSSMLPFQPSDMLNNRHLTVLVVFGLGGE